ncbi:MAG: hypothetical protein ACKV19_28000 [Verrucomicrobiales bacterium]
MISPRFAGHGAVGLLAVAAGLGLWHWQSAKRSASAAHEPLGEVRAGMVDQGPVKPAPLEGSSERTGADAREPGVPGGEANRPAPLSSRTGGSVPAAPVTDEEVWAGYQPTREELEYRAFRAEREAEHELRNLLPVLGLDEEQQDRVFAALVHRSPFYHPSLQLLGSEGAPITAGPSRPTPAPTNPVPDVDGVTPAPAPDSAGPAEPTPTDPVLAELTPELADVYERYTSERHAFWVGIVEDIEQELNEQ